MIERPATDGMFAPLTDVAKAYEQWLLVNSPGHRIAFERRLKDDPETARAEAAVFTLLLRSLKLDPFPAEDLATGGPDFVCRACEVAAPVVEVTIVRADAVAEKSGLPTKIDEEVRFFGQITNMLRTRAVKKAVQLHGQSGATVLAICLEHDYSDLLMGAFAARWLMTGEPRISARVHPEPGEFKEVTRLRESVFFRFRKDGSVEPCRRTISAILLLGISENETRAFGLLHPDATVALDYERFFPIPFLTVANWPLAAGNEVQVEWKVPRKEPDPAVLLHQSPMPTDAELRRGS